MQRPQKTLNNKGYSGTSEMKSPDIRKALSIASSDGNITG